MKRTAVMALISICLAAFAAAATSAPQVPIAADLDALLSSVYKPNEPGAAFLIWKDGTVLVRKAFGMADLELGVRMEPDMIFRIGSMTKQFTAAAILMLMEQGKLALADPITKFLPDYPTQGKTITVEHLLTHTSGIKSYTEIDEFGPLVRKDMAVPELIAVFKDKPMDFAPGERWRYDNSGYFLLGAIIEKVSGLTYEAFLQKNIFGPLGMTHTYYGNAARIIPRRIPGYGPGPDSGFSNAEFLSMALPYAAGSLLSNVDDLAVWNAALLAGKVLKPETLARAWTPYKLPDGTSTGYGYGWSVGEYEGHRMIRHNGGINGFSTDGILFPEDKLFVALLTNSSVGKRTPDAYNFRAAALALGKPLPAEPKAVALDAAILDQYVGEYEISPGFSLKFFRDGAKFMTQATGQGAAEVFAESETKFFLKVVDAQVEFTKDAAGKVTGMVLSQNGRRMPGKKIK